MEFKLNFNQLNKYRWTNSDGEEFPITGCLQFYRACGVYDTFVEYAKDIPDGVCPMLVLFCNPDTLQKIKDFIKSNWENYHISIDMDGHVFWSKDNHNKLRYKRKLSAVVTNCVSGDFFDLCPGVDPQLPDDVIVFSPLLETKPEVEIISEESKVLN